jgi:hypothetical protein
VSDQQDTGSKDRATVSLVYRTVDDLKDLTKAEFAALNSRLDLLAPLPEKVNALHERVVLGEARILALETSDKNALTETEQRKLYRKFQLPSLLLGALAIATAIVPLLIHG